MESYVDLCVEHCNVYGLNIQEEDRFDWVLRIMMSINHLIDLAMSLTMIIGLIQMMQSLLG